MSDLLAQGKHLKQQIAAQPIVRQRRILDPSATSSRRTGASSPDAAKIHQDAATMTRVYEVIEFLKKSQRPCTMDEIRMHIHDFQVEGPEFQQLTNNAKVIYNSKSHTFAYKPEFDIQTSAELLEYLRQMPDQGGLEVKKLNDSYLADKLTKVVSELRESKQVLAITDKDNRARYLFYNNWPNEDIAIDQEMKTSWMRMQVPDENELAEEMKRAGLKPTQIEKGEEEKVEVKKPKRAQRKT
ncbi:transcription factor TFIIE beta subunit, TFIIEB, Tfa2 [Coemansia sp. RSA 678]|nr:transcription factor TFIIE beta subunit, TFIIEB, Tfa2 [Coemansia sp. RSA 678]